MSLLEQFGGPIGSFRPSTVQEFISLQVARKLDDAGSFRWYVHTLSGMPQADLLLALNKTFHSEPGPKSTRADLFRQELNNLSTNIQSHA